MNARLSCCLCAVCALLELAAAAPTFSHLASLLPFEDPGQTVALASWLHARDVAKAQRIDVSLHTVEVAGEPSVWRDAAFERLPDLMRTTRQVLSTVFNDAPNLPLLRDVLERALLLPGEFIVLTNADIGLVPNFYSEVLAILQRVAVKALSINRVGVGNWTGFVPEKAGEAVDLGPVLQLSRHFPQAHPGSDCFVFQRHTVERMISAVGYVFYGQAPFGQLMLEAMRSATGLEPIEIARRRLTFHLDPIETNRKFEWADKSDKSLELLAFNNLAGFGLAPGKLVFQSLGSPPATSDLMERVSHNFVVPREVAMDKTGYFVDPGQCFSENGTISGVALVAMCTSPTPQEPALVLGIDRIRMENATSGRYRGRRRLVGLPPDLQNKKFGPSVIIIRLEMDFAAGECLGFVWCHDWAGLILGAEDASDQPIQYRGLDRDQDPDASSTGSFMYPVRLQQRLAVRAIVHFESDTQKWFNQTRSGGSKEKTDGWR
ncbi:kidins220 [Symbiodinium natans]|uniref:Kidins220 protein n=1 Tax=Symbiodinium natans TaxID=878477 RepID=A0A812H280_9DINO|nr:kidins220 [Symbiodinium natans]